METKYETIVDDNQIEIIVSYETQATQGYYEEIGNPSTWVESTRFTELKIVEVVIGGIGTDILPLLTEHQQLVIKSKLTYE